MSLTITANLKNLANTANVGWAVFTLVGYGNSQPEVSEAIIVGLTVKATADSNGAISQVILGNDVITPAGTSYTVAVYDSSGGLVAIARYRFTGSGTADLSTLTPL
jgi:hypothetical protein